MRKTLLAEVGSNYCKK